MSKRLDPKTKLWIGAVCLTGIVVALLVFARDRHLTDGVVSCGDAEGPRPQIDLRKFETDYTGYSISLEAEIVGKGKLAGKVEPAALQKLSESIQAGQEFRKALVAGYDACAVTRHAYQKAILRFQSLDGLAHQIGAFAAKPNLEVGERDSLKKLVEQYISSTQQLGGDN